MIRLFFLLVFISELNCAWTQKSGEEVSISISLDHADWVYKPGEKARFSIIVTRQHKTSENAVVHYEIGPEKMPAFITKTVQVNKNKPIIETATLAEPGFLRCIATIEIDGKKYRALATAAYDPLNIKAVAKMPDDFKTFWQDARAAALNIPLDSKMVLLPERCTEKINVYQVSMANFSRGSRLYGILCMPRKQGKYPVLLKVPGAGIRNYKGDTALAEKGIITLEIGIHGIPVTMATQVYYDLAFGPLKNYFLFNLDDRDQYYYKRVYLGCLRAVDFLVSLPQADTSRIAVYGGSQGGALAIVTAALDSRIKYMASFYPALSDVTGYLQGRAGGWPHMFKSSDTSLAVVKEKIKTSAYYDVTNFARFIKVPGIYCWGFNDEVCPPTSIYAAYNNIQAPKQTVISKESGHWLTTDQSAKVNKWLFQQFKLNIQ